MKRRILFIIVLLFVLSITYLMAEGRKSEIPDLRGEWKAQISGVVSGKDEFQTDKSEIRNFDIEGIITIDHQDSFRFSGIKSSAGKTKKFVGIIGFDNKSIYLTDEEGFETAVLVTEDKIVSYYQHSLEDRMAALRCVYIRQK